MAHATNCVARALYVLAMYTGMRAVFNQVRSLFLPDSRVSVLDGVTLQISESCRIRLRVNGRPCSPAPGSGRVAGMISVSLETPGISRIVYALLRCTSHFGSGHVELAFYEENGTVCFFAIRNILRANIRRVGCDSMFRNLRLVSDRDEFMILSRILDALGARGVKSRFAAPEECVALAVTEVLLSPRTRDRCIRTLTARYRRIFARTMMQQEGGLPGNSVETSVGIAASMPGH